MLRLNEAPRVWDSRALGRRIGRAFLGRTVFGLASAWAGFLEALGSGRLAGGAGPGPKVPTMPPFSLPRRKIIPDWEKSKVDRHIMGNSLLLMLLNFQRKFYNFFATAL